MPPLSVRLAAVGLKKDGDRIGILEPPAAGVTLNKKKEDNNKQRQPSASSPPPPVVAVEGLDEEILRECARGLFEPNWIWTFPVVPVKREDQIMQDISITKILVGEGAVYSRPPEKDMLKKVPLRLIVHPAGNTQVYYQFDLKVKYELREGSKVTHIYGCDIEFLFRLMFTRFESEAKLATQEEGGGVKSGRCICCEKDEDASDFEDWKNTKSLDVRYDKECGIILFDDMAPMAVAPMVDTFKIGGYFISLPGVASSRHKKGEANQMMMEDDSNAGGAGGAQEGGGGAADGEEEDRKLPEKGSQTASSSSDSSSDSSEDDDAAN